LRGEVDRIHAAGADLVFIGNGAPHFAEGFKKDYGVTSPLFTDPSRKAYDAAGLKYGAGSILRSLKHAARAMRKGFFQGRVQGSAWQQGGVLVIDRGGEVLYSYASQEGGDHPPVADIHTALAAAHA
jgi:peroxiredoxin